MSMTATDAMVARLDSELEERNSFIQGLVGDAQEGQRDLTSQEMEMIGRARDRIKAINDQLDPMRETARIARESRQRASEVNDAILAARRGMPLGNIEYRSAGAWIGDFVRATIGNQDAHDRIELFNRAAAHQTTADNPGLLPERLLAPILASLDFARPLVGALGPQQLPSGAWSRPKITQHTQVGKQSAEKGELPSRKLLITKVPFDVDTFGGYVNVSRQNVDWSQPQVIDIVIGDLTSEYAFETEEETGTVLTGAAVAGPVLPATPTAQDISNALWAAAGTVWGNMWTARLPMGRLILALAPDMLSLVGPLFAPVNPQNAQSAGLFAANFGEGNQTPIAGITPVVSGALPDGTALAISTNAVEVYEDRIGSLQVIEPSVLGTQVAYAGYFGVAVIEATGVVSITQGP